MLVVLMKVRLARVVPLKEAFLPQSTLKLGPSLRYFAWLVAEIIKANLAVARIILSPRMKVQPHLIEIPAEQTTLLGEVIFANSITLTPGTISIETFDKHHILVHALTEQSGTKEGLEEMGARVCQIEAPPKVKNDK